MAASILAQGVLSLVLPLVVFLSVVAWYVLLVRRHHPE
jgi:hypothetical protein